MLNKIKAPSGLILYYLGPDLDAGVLPALFYFSLSGQESLCLEPYNSVPQQLKEEKMRIFSLTLPGHEEGLNKFHAMKYWADHISQGNYLLEELITKIDEAIIWLIEKGIVHPQAIAAAGLSRGGLIAGLLVAKNSSIKTLVGFAPVVDLSVLEDFAHFKENPRLLERLEHTSLFSMIEKLTHLHYFRFYISTRDEKVDTDRCYRFIRELAEKVHEKRAKKCHVELFLTPPLGHKGHGTSPHIFEEGAAFIKRQLIK